MQRIRLTSDIQAYDTAVQHLSRIRRGLYTSSRVDIDPDNPAHRLRRDAEGRVYFELSADSLAEIQGILDDLGLAEHVRVSAGEGAAGDPCLRCGHIAGGHGEAQCTNCGFREISPCPHCDADVARRAYGVIAGDLARCPRCDTEVRLRFNDPLFDGDGEYNEPVVIVEVANEAAA